MARKKPIPLEVLQKLLQTQIRDSASRIDTRQSQTAFRQCVGQTASLARVASMLEETKQKTDGFAESLLKKADDEACALIIGTYGTYGR